MMSLNASTENQLRPLLVCSMALVFEKKIALTEVNKNVDLQQTNSNDSEFNMWSADVTKVGQDIS